ncbi:MAG: DUF134 domain-containing protein [Promethearchaeota archaeon]
MVPNSNNNEKTPFFYDPGKYKGRRRGKGREWHRGRIGSPRAKTHLSQFISSEWANQEGTMDLILGEEELKSLRLVDKEKMKQEEASEAMNISRGALWRYLDRARTKVINTLLAGKEIRVEINEN